MTNAPTQSQARARQMLEQAYAPASSGLDLEAEMMLQGIGPAINTLASALTPASDDATVERVALRAAKRLIDQINEFGGILDGELLDHADAEIRKALGLPEVDEWDGPFTPEEQAMIDAAWEKHKAAAPCTIPPDGWYCTRGRGHDGPCAAHALATAPRTSDDVAKLREALRVAEQGFLSIRDMNSHGASWETLAGWLRNNAAVYLESVRAALADGEKSNG